MDQLMFNRPVPGYAQYRSPIKGLYMCGSSTHPGGGVMGAVPHMVNIPPSVAMYKILLMIMFLIVS